MESSNRVILNSGFLYANMVVTMLVQLVSVRILYEAFGINDYAIYSLVGSLIAMFAFINVAMSAATQRFLSYAIGEGREENIRELFYQSVVLHLIIGGIVLLALEAGGVYYVQHLMRAPAESIYGATILLHCITASTFVNIITVPYEADINANENMGAIAAINILDSIMKLAVAFGVLHTSHNRLVVFGLLTMTCLIITLLLKRFYCLAKYPESHIRWHKINDFTQMRNLTSFAVWNLIGSGCSIARYQGTGMIINRFFILATNTAYGIAQQVNGLLLFFANTIVRAIRPQVVKSEGSGDRKRMLRLSETTCRITSLMVALPAIPLGICIPHILRLWLGKEAGVDCVMFCRSFLVIVFINQLTIGLQIAIESVGKIRLLQCTVGVLHLVPLFLGWWCFYLGWPVESIMLCTIGEEIVALFARITIAHHLTGLEATTFLKHTIIPCLLAVPFVTLSTWYILSVTEFTGFLHCILSFCITIPLLAVISYTMILSPQEKGAINKFMLLIANKASLTR